MNRGGGIASGHRSFDVAPGGRVVLGEGLPGDPPLPVELQQALREWAAFGVGRPGLADERELWGRRGRQLAARVAEVRGRPVEFVDPVTGAAESVGTAGAPVRRPQVLLPARSALAAGPTPWATGLTVAAFFAVFVAIADVVLSRAFADAFGVLWLPANLLVGLGLAPTLYLVRRTPFWRWLALGATVGLGAAWLVLLLALLGK